MLAVFDLPPLLPHPVCPDSLHVLSKHNMGPMKDVIMINSAAKADQGNPGIPQEHLWIFAGQSACLELQ